MEGHKVLLFKDLLKRHRDNARLTQEALAERAHLSALTISLLERGTHEKPQRATLELLIRALQLSQEDANEFRAAAGRLTTGSAIDSSTERKQEPEATGTPTVPAPVSFDRAVGAVSYPQFPDPVYEWSLYDFGAFLKRKRQTLGMSAAQVAAAAGITSAYLYMLEAAKAPRGGKASRPSLAVLEGLAGALHVSFVELCDRAGYAQVEIPNAQPKSRRLIPFPPALPSAPAFDDGMLIPPPRLIGRDVELERVLSRLRSDAKPRVVSIEGMAGVGKSALAAVAIQRVRDEGIFLPGDIVVMPCQDEFDATDVVQAILERFDPEHAEPAEARPAHLEQVARQLLSSRHALVFLDDIEPSLDIKAVVTPLLRAGATLLLCARHTLPRTVIPVEAICTLQTLSASHALELFAQSYGRDSAAELLPAERQGATEVVEILKGHALAVKLIGAYAMDAGRELRALAGELRATPQRMLALAEEASAEVEAAFRQSLVALPEDAQRLFAACSAFGTEEFGRKAALAVVRALGMDGATVDLLVRRAMLTSARNMELPQDSDHERLRFHPLLQAFAVRQFQERPRDEQDTVHRAIADFYIDYIGRVAERALAPDDNNIAYAISRACDAGDDRRVSRLCAAISQFWHDREHVDDINDLLPKGIQAAERLLDALPEAGEASSAPVLGARAQYATDLFWMTLTYGSAQRATRNLEAATVYFERSLELARSEHLGNPEGIALIRQGRFLLEQGKVQDAEVRFELARKIHRQTRDRAREAAVEVELGWLALLRGRPADAQELCHLALQQARVAEDRKIEGRALALKGRIAIYNGDLDSGQTLLLSALDLHREAENGRDEVLALVYLGEVALQRASFDDAETHFDDAIVRAEGSWYPRERGMIICRRGALERLRGRLDEAEVLYQKAQESAEESRDDQTQAAVLVGLGRIALQRGRFEMAEGRFRHALELHHQLEDRAGEALDNALLGQVAQACEQFTQADEQYRRALGIDREIKHRYGEGNDLFHMAELAYQLGNLAQAHEYVVQAIAAQRETSNRRGEARSLALMGRLALRRAELDEAEAHVRDALALMDEVHDDAQAARLRELATEIEARRHKDQPDQPDQQDARG